MNIFFATERLAALDRSVVTLDTERCLHSQYRFSGCEACFAICPANAITPGKPPVLDPKVCQACLACLPVCPVGAYTAGDAFGSLVNDVSQLEGSTLELVCEKNTQAGMGVSEANKGIAVHGCLAGLGAGAYLALIASGVGHILVRTDACPGCAWGSLSRQVETQVNQAKRILEAWKKELSLDCVPVLEFPVVRPLWKAANPPVSRRDLFRMVARQGQITISRTLEEGKSHAEHRPGRDRLRIVNTISRLPVPASNDGSGLGEMGFASLFVSKACTACEACARACPTSALKIIKDVDETAFNLTLSVPNCIGCDICKHVCNCSAINVNHSPTYAQIFSQPMVVLQAGGLVKCEQCGILMAAQPEVHLCTMCEHQRTHSAIRMPGK